jgi:hypothetical protein
MYSSDISQAALLAFWLDFEGVSRGGHDEWQQGTYIYQRRTRPTSTWTKFESR